MTLLFYYHPMSQPSRAVLSFLLLNNIPHDKKVINLLKGESRTPEFCKVNPLQFVPAIDDNGFHLSESEAIVRYLMNSRNIGQNYYPSKPQERALIDRFFPFYHSILRPSLVKTFILTYPFLKTNISYVQFPTSLKEADSETEAALKKFEGAFLDGTKYVAGNSLTIADMFAANELTQIFYTTQFNFGDFAKTKDYIERCMENPSIAEVNQIVKEFPVKIKQYMERESKAKK